MAMYRIEMDPKEARWVVKMTYCLTLWRQIGDKSFENYAEARQWVDEIGLDKVYKDYNKSYVSQMMQSVA